MTLTVVGRTAARIEGRKPRRLATYEPGSTRWLRQRRTRIGGSEIADVVGLGFSSRYHLHWEKAIGLPREIDEDTEELMWWGNAEEPIIMDRYQRDLVDGHMIIRWPGTFVDPRRRWMLASPDGIEVSHGKWDTVLEIKTASAYADGWSSTDFPPKYRCQLLWNMHVLGLRKGRLIAKRDSANYHAYPVLDLDEDPDAQEDLDFLIERGEQFICDVTERNDPIPSDGSDATWSAARRIHPEIERGSIAEIPGDLPGEYLMAVTDFDRAKAELQLRKSQLIDAMGTAQNAHAVDEDGQIDANRFAYRTSKTQRDGSLGVPYVTPDSKAKKAMALTIKDLRDAEAKA